MFFSPLQEYGDFLEIREDLKRGNTPVQVAGCVDAQKGHWIAGIGEAYKYRLIITYNEVRAKELVAEYSLYDRNVCFYPAKDLIFFQADVHGSKIVRERMQVLCRLLMGEPLTVVASIDSLMDRVLPLAKLRTQVLRLQPGEEYVLADLRQRLVNMGYLYREQVGSVGEFSIRGGILDVFPTGEETPYRVEFWGEEVDSIRSFDAESQRSIENAEQLTIFPAAEFVLSPEELEAGTARLQAELAEQYTMLRSKMLTEEAARLKKTTEQFLETLQYLYTEANLDSYLTYFCKDSVTAVSYFPEQETLFVLDEPSRVVEKGELTQQEFAESMRSRLEHGYILPGQAEAVWEPAKVLGEVLSKKTMLLSAFSQAKLPVRKKYELQAKTIASYQQNFEGLVNDIRAYRKKRYRVLIVSPSRSRAERLAKDLTEYGDDSFVAFYSDDRTRELQEREICVTSGNLRRGFEYPLIRFVVIAESDIFGEQPKKKKKLHQYDGSRIQTLHELSFGDVVVHENHGIGIYRGIKKLKQDKSIKDYLKIEYEGGNLYVPVTNLDVLQKYAGAEQVKKPKLNRLGGQEWHKTKSKVKASVKQVAEDLVQLYAARQAKRGHAFGRDTVWQKEFEEMFPFTETEDQLKAIAETKADMESERIMDRLVCGDVGFGKTEIAIRAAFKAVSDGMQVAVLVPTTILAQQHFTTFTQRLKDFPVSVEMLSRFRTPAESKKILQRLERGTLDIVIGTHRLFSKDVKYHKLGLLIVDEEQRFGVSHKEKLKKLKETVDVLTLTATPIPRTLHMSLVGIRDMSVLEEPPVDRLPIQTFVMEYSEESIREAIHREMARGGQVYFVHNTINDIDMVVSKIAALCPEASVAYAHGQMSERELERIMFAFVNGELDVLVSTTIVETGMDISNVNTIIIDQADRMGLSQLYQLRGRVGRSNRTAYAFLMYKKDKVLSEVAEKRLSAIREFTDLGSGFKISMRDLEIRGAGNLLGEEQSGHMSAVGYDLYCKLLNQAVQTLKNGAGQEEAFETQIVLEADAYIPSTYIRNEGQKLDMYKRISMLQTREEVVDLQEELTDRYGDVPECVLMLLEIALLKSMANKAYVEKLEYREGNLVLYLCQKAKLDPDGLFALVREQGGRLRAEFGKKPMLSYRLVMNSREKKEKSELLLAMQEFVGKLLALRDEGEEKKE